MTDDLSHLDFDPEEPPPFPSVEVLHRRALFDATVNAKEIAEAVGLPPISDEQAIAERAASVQRLFVTGRLNAGLMDHSDFMAAVFIRIQKEAAKRDGLDVPDESWASAYDHLRSMLNVTTVSAISLLVDLGALHLDNEWQQPSEQQEHP
jgi:hypothetical protein